MYAGCIVESAPVNEFFSDPRHPYSIGLIHAIPRLSDTEDDLYSIPGNPPDLIDIKAGCPFAPRCPKAVDACRSYDMHVHEIGNQYTVRCPRREDGNESA
jgi:oligopeptide/dipeptide ABC transporter ATP-binding protein